MRLCIPATSAGYQAVKIICEVKKCSNLSTDDQVSAVLISHVILCAFLLCITYQICNPQPVSRSIVVHLHP